RRGWGTCRGKMVSVWGPDGWSWSARMEGWVREWLWVEEGGGGVGIGWVERRVWRVWAEGWGGVEGRVGGEGLGRG
ncbi:hypothetical protein, partial [Microbacterium testaceum]|uniref:hypothetical protein n=1 Tax=Microbacterium testaceum TaxID=2033 RepID=UPI001C9E3BE9